MKEKILSVILSLAVVISCIAISSTAYAKTYDIPLDTLKTVPLEGSGDLATFVFTPECSGTYSFLSYCTPATQAFLFIRPTDPVTHEREYIQLAYAIDDPNYSENGHNNRQFCLTYHLDAGVKYYFMAGWYDDNRVSGNISVMLRCDEYDVKIDKIEVYCPIILDVYTGGDWLYDENGERYYSYGVSRIQANSTVTIYYSDGTSSTAVGAETIDGYKIYYNHEQYYNHWYPESSPEYTANTLTVRVLDAKTQLEIPIASSPIYPVRGKVLDIFGEPVAGAQIRYDTSVVGETASDGTFSFSGSSGKHTITVEAKDGINREYTVVVSAGMVNDLSENPFEICTLDYVDDEIINAKDYAVMLQTFDGDELEKYRREFENYINFTAEDYE